MADSRAANSGGGGYNMPALVHGYMVWIKNDEADDIAADTIALQSFDSHLPQLKVININDPNYR